MELHDLVQHRIRHLHPTIRHSEVLTVFIMKRALGSAAISSSTKANDANSSIRLLRRRYETSQDTKNMRPGVRWSAHPERSWYGRANTRTAFTYPRPLYYQFDHMVLSTPLTLYRRDLGRDYIERRSRYRSSHSPCPMQMYRGWMK